MLEITLKNYLEKVLSVPCKLEVPQDLPEKLIRIERLSAQYPCPGMSTVRIAVQSYAQTLYGAALLNEIIKAAMEDFDTLADISAAKLLNDHPFPDTGTKRYRWQAVYDITYYPKTKGAEND